MSSVWEPEPSWQRLPGSGPGSGGVWCVTDERGSWILKRLERPEDPHPNVSRPAQAGYWRREAEVASDPAPVTGPGLVPTAFGAVEEDAEGITVWSEEVVAEPPPGLFVARALGRFASSPYDAAPWASRSLLADRLAMAQERGGWPTLARTNLADVTDHLWTRRGHWLDRIARGPEGRLHGDAVPRNFLAQQGDDVVAVDWQCTGIGPIGTDVGYFSLSSREDFGVLVDAFLDGARTQTPDLDAESVVTAACVTAVYSVLSRAEWALAHVARGEGALLGKFRHPAVLPHLRAVERMLPQIERLL